MADKKHVNWDAIKNDYISDPEASLRSLSEKYGISASAIHRRAKEGEWLVKRKQLVDKTETKTLEKLIEERAKGEVKRLKKLYDATDKLTQKVLEGIKKVSPGNTLAIRQLVSSLKELRLMEGVAPTNHESEDELSSGVVILPEVDVNLTPPAEPSAAEDGEADG